MQNDYSYSTLKQDKRAYNIMLLYDQQEIKVVEIAKRFEISSNRVLQIYYKIKIKQVRLYIRHIALALGYENILQITKIYQAADNFYQNTTYACAYLEKLYPDILKEYRAGEPGMPEWFLKKMPPFRERLQKRTVARIIKMREEEKLSFLEIGRRLRIMPEKAKHTYDMFYYRKALALIKELQDDAGSEEEKKVIWDQCFEKYLSAKKLYEELTERKNRETRTIRDKHLNSNDVL